MNTSIKYLIMPLLSLFLFCASFGQSVKPEVVASSGDYYQNADTKLSWTLGECVSETFTNTDNILTQGFQQCSFIVAVVEENMKPDQFINIYPNPASDIIHLERSDNFNTSLSIIIYDNQGKELLNEKYDSSKISISLKQFSSNIFFIKVATLKEGIIKTFKIMKVK